MKISTDIFNINKSQPLPQRGDILVAEPFLAESYFERSVISVIEYSEEASTTGIVLNKQTQYTLQDAIADIRCNEPIPLFCGGPLSSDRLFYIHTLGHLIADSIELFSGLCFGGDFRAIKAYVESGNQIEGKIRFFMGYSGWDKGQLVEELNNYVWAVSSMSSDTDKYLIGSENKYWRDVVKDLGVAYRKWLVLPEYPYLN